MAQRCYPRIKTAIWDCETDGLLPTMTTIHVLVVRDFERRKTYRFRRNDVEDTIDEGLDLLEDAEMIVGHNNMYFDEPAIDKIYEGFKPRGVSRDCLVMARMCFADQKDKDFRLFERGSLPGKFIGVHSLKAWGYRLNLHKGDYADNKEAEAKALGITDPAELVRFVWGTWNQEMEDYCALDVDVTTMLWSRIIAMGWSEQATELEHDIHRLMGEQERNGIPFDVQAAEKLAEELENEGIKLERQLIEHYGKWWKPAKKRILRKLWEDQETTKVYAALWDGRYEVGPNAGELVENLDRPIWADITYPKRNVRYKEPERGTYSTDAPYCKVELQEFNPGSRPQIIDRFIICNGWHPVDFTDKGNPEVSDEVLRKLGDSIPMAKPLAELFYYNKRLSQLKTGQQAWLKQVDVDGLIHHYCNVGGTISGRASHVGPNLGQVPRVVIKKIDGKSTLLKGRAGDHGWDCRNLFYVPEPWMLCGIDLSGIELRCFAEKLAKYDGGAYRELVLSGDPHSYNQNLAGLDSRDSAKTFIYALLYGAGDVKLGSIVAPLASEEEQRAIGVRLREKFMSGLPAYAAVIKEVRAYARKGFIPGLDGRRLYVRSPHSALNTWLQSDAALIAKRWVVETTRQLIKLGLRHGWNGDFVQLLWIHDEEQIAHMPDFTEIVRSTAIQAAKDTGIYFKYGIPVDAEAKVGRRWSECH